MSVVIRSIIAVLLFGSFIALWFWAWRKENAAYYDAAARLPLNDDADSAERSRIHPSSIHLKPISQRIGP